MFLKYTNKWEVKCNLCKSKFFVLNRVNWRRNPRNHCQHCLQPVNLKMGKKSIKLKFIFISVTSSVFVIIVGSIIFEFVLFYVGLFHVRTLDLFILLNLHSCNIGFVCFYWRNEVTIVIIKSSVFVTNGKLNCFIFNYFNHKIRETKLWLFSTFLLTNV